MASPGLGGSRPWPAAAVVVQGTGAGHGQAQLLAQTLMHTGGDMSKRWQQHVCKLLTGAMLLLRELRDPPAT